MVKGNKDIDCHIIIFGNIASGKSTVSKAMETELCKSHIHYGIDIFRPHFYKELPHQPLLAERNSKEKLLFHVGSALHSQVSVIFETVTASLLYEKVRYELIKSGRPIRRYLIDTPIEECYRRHQQRMANGHQVIAPPFVDQTKIREGMRKIHHELKGIEAERIDGMLPAREIVELILTKTKTKT